MKLKILTTSAMLSALYCVSDAQVLGVANTFAVFAGSTITNVASTVISGDVGVWPGSAITGFPPGIIINGSIHANNAIAFQAHNDIAIAYNALAAQSPDQNLTGQDLAGLTLLPGVYRFNSSSFLTGKLTLDAQGDPNARFDFQIGSTLISAANSMVEIINGGVGSNVFWQVGSSATLGTNTEFAGNILAYSSITVMTGSSINQGSALARNGAVTLDYNRITVVSEPNSLLFLGFGGTVLAFLLRRNRS